MTDNNNIHRMLMHHPHHQQRQYHRIRHERIRTRFSTGSLQKGKNRTNIKAAGLMIVTMQIINSITTICITIVGITTMMQEIGITVSGTWPACQRAMALRQAHDLKRVRCFCSVSLRVWGLGVVVPRLGAISDFLILIYNTHLSQIMIYCIQLIHHFKEVGAITW